MKVIGKRVTAVICPKCGALMQVNKKDWKEKSIGGNKFRFITCGSCKSSVRIEGHQIFDIFQMNNPGEYMQFKH